MLAYRHAFHAGNHADVLKHLTLVAVLRHMNLKEKNGYRIVDTHAGAGGYSLRSEYAHKRDEFEQGTAKLWQHDSLPAALADYVKDLLSLGTFEGVPILAPAQAVGLIGATGKT